MTMACCFIFMEVVLVEGIGQLNLDNTSKLDEPSSSSLLVPLAEPRACRALGRWGGHGGDVPDTDGSLRWEQVETLLKKCSE